MYLIDKIKDLKWYYMLLLLPILIILLPFLAGIWIITEAFNIGKEHECYKIDNDYIMFDGKKYKVLEKYLNSHIKYYAKEINIIENNWVVIFGYDKLEIYNMDLEPYPDLYYNKYIKSFQFINKYIVNEVFSGKNILKSTYNIAADPKKFNYNILFLLKNNECLYNDKIIYLEKDEKILDFHAPRDRAGRVYAWMKTNKNTYSLYKGLPIYYINKDIPIDVLNPFLVFQRAPGKENAIYRKVILYDYSNRIKDWEIIIF